MATRIGRKAQAHLYIREWLDFRGLSDEKAASRLGIDRTTVWKWRTQPRRLTRDKIESLAVLLDIEPEELYRPPNRPSLDAMVKDAPEDIQDMAVDIVRRLVGR
jgi:transcriptional regulator with XRE-family HTH domain